VIGHLYEGESLAIQPSFNQNEINLDLLSSVFEDHFKRFEKNNTELLEYIQLSKNYLGKNYCFNFYFHFKKL
jgi:hypothetical protein